eukprot:8952471-Alexandrium_andersonii.AAC.1
MNTVRAPVAAPVPVAQCCLGGRGLALGGGANGWPSTTPLVPLAAQPWPQWSAPLPGRYVYQALLRGYTSRSLRG